MWPIRFRKKCHQSLNKLLQNYLSCTYGAQFCVQEYVGDRGKDQDKDWIVTEKDRFDRELDKNGDGSLGRAEMIEWLIPSQDSIADDEVKHLFAAADDDDDDVLR